MQGADKKIALQGEVNMDENVVIQDDELVTRKCLICEKKESPDVELVSVFGWVCPDCQRKIGKLIGILTDD